MESVVEAVDVDRVERPVMREYGLRITPDSRVVQYPSREAAAAAQQRMLSWPTTKWAKLMVREVQTTPWMDEEKTMKSRWQRRS